MRNPSEILEAKHTFISRTVGEFENDLVPVARFIETRTLKLLMELDTMPDGRLRTTAENLGRLRMVRKQLVTVFGESGYQELVGDLLRKQDKLLVGHHEFAEAYDITPSFSVENKLAILALKDGMTAEFVRIGDGAVLEIARQLDFMVMGQRPVAEAARHITGVLEKRLKPYAKTYAETALSIYDGKLNELTFPTDDDSEYAYLGPLDALTRPFCRALVGKVFTIAQIREMDNGQIPDVYISKGGYNCRHDWVYVPEDQLVVERKEEKEAPTEDYVAYLKKLRAEAVGRNAKERYANAWTEFKKSPYYDAYLKEKGRREVAARKRQEEQELEEHRRREKFEKEGTSKDQSRYFEDALKELGLEYERRGYENDSQYFTVLTHEKEMGDESIIRLSDHAQPVGGGYSVEKMERHGGADFQADPSTGLTWRDALEFVRKSSRQMKEGR